MALFKDNKDFDSTLIIIIYGLALLIHIGFAGFVETYGSSEVSKNIGQWVTNVGLVIVGALFRKQDNGNNQKEKTNEQ